MSTPPPGAIIYELSGELLWLLSQRALYWPAQQCCIVADVHLGKDATFNSKHITVPQKSTIHDLRRLTDLIDLLQPKRLLILGDLLHAPAGTTAEVRQRIHDWRQKHSDMAIHWIRGNHDHALSDFDPAVHQHPRELIMKPFVFRHHPGTSEDGYVLAGHLHPGLPLTLQGERLRLPCFNFRNDWGVLPAFSLFTGLYELPRRKGTHAVVTESDVLLIP